ncbi:MULTISPECIES: BtrH N-terminal domain-containing protein [Bacillus]|uniref:BtrH N-terminal domain-containing protein n=2 Tax=Bacillaceae TaxID=186817 RepID=UPI00027BFF84|nr:MULTISPECIES: BtrH N-terminal domain-containing protein [Bacillus]EJV74920.1 hypothetical protein IGE_05458 [Bacillus cereus HuB1-1]MED3622119.1 BtrH N-terminal domain-containing protein [Bacillus thuringiensis]HDX9688678.1 hypothetical protein [Bacillus thuringiensis]
MKNQYHCLYQCLQTYIKHEYNFRFNISDIFNILGGHHFYFEDLKNPMLPVYKIRSNVIDFDCFNQHTKFSIKRIYENDINEAVNNTIVTLNHNKQQLVFVNCFYLPYDYQNFKKNIDNHMIIVTNFNEINNEFTIFDPRYGEQKLSKNDYILARQNTLQKKSQYLKIRYSSDEIHEIDILNIIKINNFNYMSEGLNNLIIFKDIIKKIDKLEGIHRKIALNNLSQSFRHPHGPITTRALMAESFTNTNNHIMDVYNDLAKHWFIFANSLVRLQHNKIKVDTLINIYDHIINKEHEGATLIAKVD